MIKKFLNGGELSNKQFYGIPYELDFDLLYFNDQNKDSSLLKQLLLLEVPTNDTHTSDKDRRTIDQREGRSVLSSNSLNRRDSKGKSITLSATDPSLSIALGDNDELLKLFLEYVGHQFGLPEDNDPDYFKKFYNNKESKSLYPSFQQFLTIKLKLNLNQTLTITPKKAIEAFIHNEKMTLKGKASYYHNLKEVLPKTILLGKALPPDQTSIINTKYLVINNKSLKDKRGLVELAKALTSPEIQNYRADTFGSIPTFDMKQKNSDPVIRTYCQTHKELCEMIEHLIPFHLQKMITQDKYSSSVMEARFVLPNAIRIFLQKNTEAPIMDAYSSIMEVKGLGVDGIHFIQLAIIIIVIIAILFLLFIMTMVYKNRMHPYLKAISPGLCILIILGLILNLIDPIYGSLLRSIILCKIEFVHKIISHTLTIFPMYTIVYRIHYIFTNTSKVNISKKFNDHFLIRLTIISLFVIFIVSIVIAYEITFTLVTLGNLQDFRSIYCFNTIYFIYYPIVALFYIFMFVSMLKKILKINKIIKKCREIRFIYIMVLLLFSSVLFNIIILLLPREEYYLIFFIIYCLYICCCLYCANLLVGSRLLYIIHHPMTPNNVSQDDLTINEYFLNIADFIPLKKEMKKQGTYLDRDNLLFPSLTSTTNNSSLNKSEGDRSNSIGKAHKNSKSSRKSNPSHSSRHENDIKMNEYPSSHEDIVMVQDAGVKNHDSIDNDSIANNPNNYFFNKTLERLNSLD